MIIVNEALRSTMDYPVGSHINKNILQIREMANSLNSIEEFKERTINLICSGSSGAIIAGIITTLIPNYCVIHHIKKDGEQAHSSQIETITNDGINVIIDDFIATGRTMARIYKTLLEVHKVNEFQIDCLCFTGTFFPNDIKFNPKYIICGDKHIC